MQRWMKPMKKLLIHEEDGMKIREKVEEAKRE